MQTVCALADYMAPIARSSMLETFIIPSLIIFAVMFICGLFSGDLKNPWKKYFIGSSIPVIGISVLILNPIVPLVLLPVIALTVGGSSYLGIKIKTKGTLGEVTQNKE